MKYLSFADCAQEPTLGGRFTLLKHRIGLSMVGGTIALLAAAGLHAQVPGPAGVFVIGDTREIPGEIDRYDWSVLSGYTLRVPWSDLESWDSAEGRPVYDFGRIERALTEIHAKGRRLNLEVFVAKAPAYLQDSDAVVFWDNPHPRAGGLQPVPWDATTLEAYEIFLSHLAGHVVQGTEWTIAGHPALASVDAPIVGLHSVRELSGALITHPGYNREIFLSSAVRSVRASRQVFRQKAGFLAFFRMEDNLSTPALDESLFELLESEFNQSGGLGLGYFQETLSDTGPQPASLGLFLARGAQSSFVMFQALRPWVLREGEAVSPEIASGNPATGFDLAWRSYGAIYAEIYGADLLHGDHVEEIREWDRFFRTIDAVRNQRLRPQIHQVQNELEIHLTMEGETVRSKFWSSENLQDWRSDDIVTNGSRVVTQALPTCESMGFYRFEILPPTLSERR